MFGRALRGSHLFEESNRELPVSLEPGMTLPKLVPVVVASEFVPRSIPLDPVSPFDDPGHVRGAVCRRPWVGSEQLALLAEVDPESRYVPTITQPRSGLRGLHPVLVHPIRVVVVVADFDQHHSKL